MPSLKSIEDLINKKVTVPEYFNKNIDSSVDLVKNNWQCCPFHKEKTPSFRYNPITGIWQCFGKCKKKGKTVEMHMMRTGIETKEEAILDLQKILGITAGEVLHLKRRDLHTSSELDRECRQLYLKALGSLKTVEDWIDFDYVMSQNVIKMEQVELLKSFLNTHSE